MLILHFVSNTSIRNLNHTRWCKSMSVCGCFLMDWHMWHFCFFLLVAFCEGAFITIAGCFFITYCNFSSTGIGFGLACSPSIIAVERTFIHGRFQALSIVVAGIGAGIITFPIMIRYLLEYFAWRGTFLILSGIALNLCVCGAIMRPKSTDKVSPLARKRCSGTLGLCVKCHYEVNSLIVSCFGWKILWRIDWLRALCLGHH